MHLVELMKSMIAKNDIAALHVLCKQLADYEDEFVKLGASLATTELKEDLLNNALAQGATFEIILAIIGSDNSPELSGSRLIRPHIIMNEVLLDALLQNGSRITPKIRQSPEYQNLKEDQKAMLEAKQRLFDVVHAVKTAPGYLEPLMHARQNNIREGLSCCAASSMTVLAQFINDITSLRKANPFTQAQWNEFKDALTTLPRESEKYILLDKFSDYVYPTNDVLMETNVEALTIEQRNAIKAKAQDIKAQLERNASDDDMPNELLAWYFNPFNKLTLTLEETEKVKNARKILADCDSLYDYYCANVKELVTPDTLTPTQELQALHYFSECCARGIRIENPAIAATPLNIVKPLQFLQPKYPQLTTVFQQLKTTRDADHFETLHKKLAELETRISATQVYMGLLTRSEYLLAAIDIGATGMVKHHLQRDADVNVRDNNFKTPLMIAASKCDLGSVRVLCVTPNANLNAQDIEGDTALMSAVKNRALLVADYLLRQGVDVNLQDRYKNTALTYAVSMSLPLELIKSILIRTSYHRESFRVALGSAIVNLNVDLQDVLLQCEDLDEETLQDAARAAVALDVYEVVKRIAQHKNFKNLQTHNNRDQSLLCMCTIDLISKDPRILKTVLDNVHYTQSDLESVRTYMKTHLRRHNDVDVHIMHLNNTITQLILSDAKSAVKKCFVPDFLTDVTAFLKSDPQDTLLISRALAIEAILWVKTQIQKRSLLSNDESLVLKLKLALKEDVQMVNDYLDAIIVNAEANPFSVVEWASFNELLIRAFADFDQHTIYWRDLEKKLARYHHPDVTQGKNFGDIVAVYQKSKSASSGTSSSSSTSSQASMPAELSSEAEMTIRNCIKEDFENQILPENPSSDMLNAIESLWVDKSTSPETFLKQQKQQQQARDFLKHCQSHLETFLLSSSMLFTKLRPHELASALAYLKIQLSVAIDDARESIVIKAPAPAEYSQAALVAQLGLMPVANGQLPEPHPVTSTPALLG